MKLSKVSLENLQIADRFQIEPFESGPRCLVSVYLNGNISFLQGDDQDQILFQSPSEARKLIAQVRPDLVK